MMFRVLLPVSIVVVFILFTDVDGSTFHRREYCPFGWFNGSPGGGVNVINSDVINTNIQCDLNGTVAIKYTVNEIEPSLFGDDVTLFLQLQCSNNTDHYGRDVYRVPGFSPEGGALVSSFHTYHTSVENVYHQNGTTCTIYGCVDYFVLDEIHELVNVTCVFDPANSTTKSVLPPINSSTKAVHPTTTLSHAISVTQRTGSVTIAPTTSEMLPISGTPSVTRSFTDSTMPTPSAMKTATSADTPSFVTRISTEKPTQTMLPDLATSLNTSTTQQATDKPPPPSSTSEDRSKTLTSAPEDRSKTLTTIITAVLFSSLVLLCVCVTLSIVIAVHKRKQKRLHIRRQGFISHRRHYDATLDPNFNPIDVRPSKPVGVAKSLYSVLEALKASTLSLKQQSELDEIGFDDEKSEILQSQDSDECMSSHSVVLSTSEGHNKNTSSTSSGSHTLDSNSSDNDDLRAQNSKPYADVDCNIKSPDVSQCSGYIHEHGPSLNGDFNVTSPHSSYVHSSSTIGQPTMENVPSKFMFPLKPFVFSSAYVDRYMRGQSDTSDTSSCSVGLVSNATSSSGYVSNSPAESDVGFAGFLPSSNYGLTTSIATSSSGYITESPGCDSPQKDVTGYLPHYTEDISLSEDFEQRIAQTNPVFDDFVEENKQNHTPNKFHDEQNQTFSEQTEGGYIKDCTHTSNGSTVDYVESQLLEFSDCDNKQNGTFVDVSPSFEGTEQDLPDLDCVYTELDKNNFDASSMCSLSLNPLHFQPTDLCDSDYCDKM